MAAKKRNTEAMAAVADAMGKLAYVRDLLEGWERGDKLGMDEKDCAFFIRAGMVESCKNLERGLVELGIVKADAEYFTEGEANHG